MSLTRTSRFLSMILRHRPEVIGIALDEHGWADVQELLLGMKRTHPIDMDILEEIVRTDNKQRYSFNADKTKIRANQGHSIPVDVELPLVEPPEYLWHGTGEKYVEAIGEQGLIAKSRLYVHLSQTGKLPAPWEQGMAGLSYTGFRRDRCRRTAFCSTAR